MSSEVPREIAEIIVDPASYSDMSQIGEALAWLRRNAPFARIELPDYAPFWIASKHADIQEIGRQNRIFRSGGTTAILLDRPSSAAMREMTGGRPNLIRSVLSMDPPEHGKFRRITQAYFMPKSLRSLEQDIRAIARTYVDKFLQSGDPCDFADIALHYPLQVILHIMGINAAEAPRMLKLTQELFGAQDPDLSRSKDGQGASRIAEDQANVFADFASYFGDIVTDRKANPRDDIATVVAQGQIDGGAISIEDAIAYYITLATAGHDTTSSSLAGSLHGLAIEAGELVRAKAHRELLPSLADEAFRWTTPIRHFMRSASEPATVRGMPVGACEPIMLSYLSGNRDEEIFEDASRFRLGRPMNRHLAFGYGPHLCLGQHLARMEIELFLEELLPRIAAIELAGEPQLSASTFIGGHKTLPLRVSPA